MTRESKFPTLPNREINPPNRETNWAIRELNRSNKESCQWVVDDDDVDIPISGRFPGISAHIRRISDAFDRARDVSGREFSALRGIELGNDGGPDG